MKILSHSPLTAQVRLKYSCKVLTTHTFPSSFKEHSDINIDLNEGRDCLTFSRAKITLSSFICILESFKLNKESILCDDVIASKVAVLNDNSFKHRTLLSDNDLK